MGSLLASLGMTEKRSSLLCRSINDEEKNVLFDWLNSSPGEEASSNWQRSSSGCFTPSGASLQILCFHQWWCYDQGKL